GAEPSRPPSGHLLHSAREVHGVRRVFRSGAVRGGVPGRLLRAEPRRSRVGGAAPRQGARDPPRARLPPRLPVPLPQEIERVRRAGDLQPSPRCVYEARPCTGWWRPRTRVRRMGKIAIGIVGMGNCASSLLQGIEFYRAADGKSADAHVGLMHHDVCGYRPSDIEVVCAFDVDQRKVGQPLDVAALAPPNNTRTLYPKLPRSSVIVEMGPVLDGLAEHMRDYPPDAAFVVAERRPVDVVEVLRRSGAEMVVNYLPVGSQAATEHYARARP